MQNQSTEHLQSKGSELERCFLNCSFKSLLTPMSWNMRWSLEVYSKPHACWGWNEEKTVKHLLELKEEQWSEPSSLNKCTDLKFGDHAGLGVVAGAVLMHQSFGQHLGIELLEHVFILNILENHHLMKKDVGEFYQSHINNMSRTDLHSVICICIWYAFIWILQKTWMEMLYNYILKMITGWCSYCFYCFEVLSTGHVQKA